MIEDRVQLGIGLKLEHDQGCNISDITLTSGRLSGFRFYDYLEFGVGV